MEELSKDAAIASAGIIGIGHHYLGKKRLFYCFMAGAVFLVLFFVVSILIASMEKNFNGLFIAGMIMMWYLLMGSISMIDTAYQCDVMGIRYTRKEDKDFRIIKNYGFTFHLWISIFSIAGIIITTSIIMTQWNSWFTITVLVIWCLIFIVGNILVSMYRNVKYYEILPSGNNEK